MAIRLLLVEDVVQKRDEILDLVRENFPRLHIETAGSLTAARTLLLARPHFDIVLVDMTLPREPTEPAAKEASTIGSQLIEDIDIEGLATKVIVVSGYSRFPEKLGGDLIGYGTLDEFLRAKYSRFYLGWVSYEHGALAWGKNLTRILDDAFRSRRKG